MKLKKDMLAQICQLIQQHPEHFDMGHWASGCGTSGCIAGWAMLIDRFEAKPQEFVSLERLMGGCTCDQSDHIKDAAREGQRVLGLCYNDAHVLFYTGNWPEPFQRDYNEAECEGKHTEMAAVTVRRIQHFMEKGE